MNQELIDKAINLNEAKAVVRMGKKAYEALRAVEQTPTGAEQLLFEACHFLEKALSLLESAKAEPEPSNFRAECAEIREIYLNEPAKTLEAGHWLVRRLAGQLAKGCDEIDRLTAELAKAQEPASASQRLYKKMATELAKENKAQAERIAALEEAVVSGCCSHSVQTKVDEDGCCISCGENLNCWFELVARNDQLEAANKILKAEAEGAGSLLLDVQQECIRLTAVNKRLRDQTDCETESGGIRCIEQEDKILAHAERIARLEKALAVAIEYIGESSSDELAAQYDIKQALKGDTP